MQSPGNLSHGLPLANPDESLDYLVDAQVLCLPCSGKFRPQTCGWLEVLHEDLDVYFDPFVQFGLGEHFAEDKLAGVH